MSDNHNHDRTSELKEFTKQAPSPFHHEQLLKRAAAINLELVNIINELASYDLPYSNSDLELSSKSMIESGSRLTLTPLTERLVEGVPDTMLATFNIDTNQFHPTNPDPVLIHLVEALFKAKRYDGIIDPNSKLYCVELKQGQYNNDPEPLEMEIAFEYKAGEIHIATIGPNRTVSLKKPIEELTEVFEQHGYDSEGMGEQMESYSAELDNRSVVYVNLIPTK